MKRMCFAAVVALTCAGWTVQAVAQVAISNSGVTFPDGSVQTTAAAGGAPVEDTGQTACFAEDGMSRVCNGTGEDGENQAGVAWPTPRFTDNGDGTVTDNLTGLIWLKDANCPGPSTWQEALDWVALFNTTSIACTDYAGGMFSDWRLPNIKELLSLVDFSQSSPALPSGHPFGTSVQSSFYWSSSSRASFSTNAWGVSMSSGDGSNVAKSFIAYVWPVRSGQ